MNSLACCLFLLLLSQFIWTYFQLQDKTSSGSVPALREKLNVYAAHRGIEKPPRVEDKALLEALTKSLQTRLKLAKKPSFMPSQGQSIEEIKDAWNQMEHLEKGFEVSDTCSH